MTPVNWAIKFLLVTMLWLAATASLSWACSVPVFRYALERWPPDDFTAFVFYEDTLPDEASNLITTIEKAHSNLKIQLVDLKADPRPEWVAMWEEQETEHLPWLYVTYPDAHPVAVELTSERFTAKSVNALLDSPAREEVERRLTNDHTAVWVLIESGRQTADDEAATILEANLRELEETLELPEIEQEDIDAGLLSVDESELKIAFSSMRLSREDAVEEMFVRMLLDTEEDLLDLEEPTIIPVFGRGRALYALVGGGIDKETITEAARYLTGACSCQVKAENPGVDLLMAANWDANVTTSYQKPTPMPELTGLVAPKTPTRTTIASESGEPVEIEVVAKTTNGSQSRLILWTTLPALGLMLIILVVGSRKLLRGMHT